MATPRPSANELRLMKNSDLKALLVDLKLPSTGNKASMIQRLTEYFEAEVVDMPSAFSAMQDIESQIKSLELQLEIDKLEKEITKLSNSFKRLNVPTTSGFVQFSDRTDSSRVSRSVKDPVVKPKVPMPLAHSTVNNPPRSAPVVLQSRQPTSTTREATPATLLDHTQGNIANLPVTQQDLSQLINAFTQSLNTSKLPIPEPPIFSGNVLDYNDWNKSFTVMIESKPLSDIEKLFYLRNYVSGEAKQAINGYFVLNSENAYKDAKALLDKRYGSPFLVSQAFRHKLYQWPKLPNGDSKALINLTDFLIQCKTAMNEIPSLSILNDSEENKKMVRLLPETLAMRWNRKVVSFSQENNDDFPPFDIFVKFLVNETAVASHPVTSLEALHSGEIGTSYNKQDDEMPIRNKNFQRLVDKPSNLKSVKCFVCADSHKIFECSKFETLAVDERQDVVKTHRLCYLCLNQGHRLSSCRYKRNCKFCGGRHNSLLHRDFNPNAVINTSNAHCGKVKGAQTKQLSSMMLPVYIYTKDKPSKKILTYAMLDTQSEITFITNELASKLSVFGKQTTLRLSTMTEKSKMLQCKKFADLVIKGIFQGHEVNLPTCYGRPLVPSNGICFGSEDIEDWPHLAKIRSSLPSTQDCEVGLLIGFNCPEALAPIDSVVGVGNQPYAVRTVLGWSVVGPLKVEAPKNDDEFGISHRIMTMPITSGCLPRRVDFFGSKHSFPNTVLSSEEVYVSHRVRAKEVLPQDILNKLEDGFDTPDDRMTGQVSQNDMRFVKLLTEKIRQDKNGFYSMPLPFLKDVPYLPNNRVQALNRFHNLQKRFSKDKDLLEKYNTFMHSLISRGEAEIVSRYDTEPGKVWYLSHHGVFNSKKPDKLRVVFDASATFASHSLNSLLLQGPDLNNSLIGVLTRFREKEVAVACDIERMFYCFKVDEEYRDFLRFLWFDKAGHVVDYRMTVHVFGASSSPGCAKFGLLQLAKDYGNSFPEAQRFITDCFYVDDGLYSCGSIEEATKILCDTTSICSKGHLKLHKLMSNKIEVLRSFPKSDWASDLEDLPGCYEKNPVERALGINWCPIQDELYFDFKVKLNDVTRRQILATVASIFDPLGFLAPVILVGRIILQRLCKTGANWDEPVPTSIAKDWASWLQDLSKLSNFRMRRNMKPENFGEPVSVEVHTFADASNTGYGACSYLRLVNKSGWVHCSFLFGKSRVVPLKGSTIPRLELRAAVLAAKIGCQMAKEVSYASVKQCYWSDSQIVLAYIANCKRRFHVFVSNRVSIIRELTDVHDWNYVPSSENPADSASRGLTMQDLLQSRWINGPLFLSESCRKPFTKCLEEFQVPDDDLEVKIESSKFVHLSISLNDKRSNEVELSLLQRVERFSSWRSAIRFIAIVNHVIKSRWQVVFDPDVEILQSAEHKLIKLVQKVAFVHELSDIEQHLAISKASSLWKLDPFIDNDGLLRVGGRLRFSSLSDKEKYPIILPKNHYVSRLLVRHYHEISAHQGREATMAAVRSAGYWVLGLNSVVTSQIHFCVTCRRLRRSLEVQKMADLPVDRTNPTPPFTYIGLDCFGPFEVKSGRKLLKRYGLIFVCMYSRAIHVELLSDMTTDGFINSLRCFIAIRGSVRQIRCDRGSNFVGAYNELQKSLNQVNCDDLKQYLLSNKCDFLFNAPGSSHMGGAWERQIRTFRNVLNGLLQQDHRLDEESARTLMYETMTIVNSRPLTVVEHDGMKPLTPNHLLHGKSDIVLPLPGKFEESDIYLRKRWRRVQHLADVFWKRWKSQYLVSLQNRQRWSKSKRNLCVGDIVLVQDDNLFRGQWKLARVIKTLPSKDQLVRKVKIFVGQTRSVLDRPIHKLVVLIESS